MMRKIFEKLNKKCYAVMKKMTLRQRCGLLIALFSLDVVLIVSCIVSIVELVKLRNENEAKTEIYTYTYAVEHGHNITGTAGQYLDDYYYAIDETMIFGPYSEKPALQIPIADSDITIDTGDMSFAQDMIGGIGHGISDCREEQHFRLNEDMLVYAGLARYEDGEIYAYVQFLQKIENLGGLSYVAKELLLGDENNLTDEGRSQIDTIHKILDQGMKDYCLYAPSALDDVAAGCTVAIEYHANYLDLVAY